MIHFSGSWKLEIIRVMQTGRKRDTLRNVVYMMKEHHLGKQGKL